MEFPSRTVKSIGVSFCLSAATGKPVGSVASDFLSLRAKRRYAKADRPDAEPGGLATFDFLGFTHISAKSNGGRFLLKRQTMRKRMRAKLAEIKEELRSRLHQRVAEQGKWLKSVVTGYFAYHAVPTNARRISAFRYHVIQMWLKSLRRRSQRHNTKRRKFRPFRHPRESGDPVPGLRFRGDDGTTVNRTGWVKTFGSWHNMPWERMNRIIDAWIPPAVIRHPWPNQRFDVRRAACVGSARSVRRAGCAVKAHETMSPGMATAVKPSRQPRTESCVVSGNGPCEA
jgi:hypothetical protein